MLAFFKLLRLLIHILRGWLIITFIFPRCAQPEQWRHVQQWSAKTLQVLGLTLEVASVVPETGAGQLWVANHLSWIDILALHAIPTNRATCRFIAKSEIGTWPVLGAMTTAGGTLYVSRQNKRDAKSTVHQVAARLGAGDTIAVFPEGTVGSGYELLPFHANFIESAIEAAQTDPEVCVVPIAIGYQDQATQTQSFAIAYDGNKTLFQSAWGTLCAKPIMVTVRFGEPQKNKGLDRRAWASELREVVNKLRHPPKPST